MSLKYHNLVLSCVFLKSQINSLVRFSHVELIQSSVDGQECPFSHVFVWFLATSGNIDADAVEYPRVEGALILS